MRLEIVDLGEGAGVILPPELLARLGTNAGGELYAREVDGGFEFLAANSDLARQREEAGSVTHDYGDTLGRLADS